MQIFGGVGEWIIGNTFSCALFFTYGVFYTSPPVTTSREYRGLILMNRNILHRQWSPAHALLRYWDTFLVHRGFPRGAAESHVLFESR